MGTLGSPLAATAAEPRLTVQHSRRLRQMYRSAGWPCLDAIEIDLLALGLLERVRPERGAEHLRLSDAGLQHLATALHGNRCALDRHEALVARVARQELRQGRIAFCGLSLLAKPGEDWLSVRPDVFSIRNSSKPEYLEPLVYEIKVQRADLKAELKKPDKRAAYLALASECIYVLGEGVGTAEDVPPECGVMVAAGESLVTLRRAPARARQLGFTTWMALAKAERFRCLDDSEPLL